MFALSPVKIQILKTTSSALKLNSLKHLHLHCYKHREAVSFPGTNYCPRQSQSRNSLRGILHIKTQSFPNHRNNLGTISSQDSDPSLAWRKEAKEFNLGPDQILPSKADYTWEPDGAVLIKKDKIGKGENDPGSLDPISIPSFFKGAVNRFPNNVAIGIKQDNAWQTVTYEQHYRNVLTAAKGFIELGLERHHAVCILSMNSPEWFLSNFGAIFAGGVSTGIYATNYHDAVAHCAGDSRVNIFMVQDDEQFGKVEKIQSQLKHLKAVIQVEGAPRIRAFPNNSNVKILSWSQLMTLGSEKSDQMVEERLRSIAINQCSTLIYTSGTTGKAKGVMLSHDNFTWVTQSFLKGSGGVFRLDGSEKLVSFLPLSHSASQLSDLYVPLALGGSVYFADKNALKGTLIQTLKEIQPSGFLSVPRFYEKVHQQLLEMNSKGGGSPLRQKFIDFAKAQAYTHNLLLSQGNQEPNVPGFKLLDKILFSKIKQQMGLGNCRNFFAGAAPLSIDIMKYFMSLNMFICEVYGLTETSGPHTVHSLSKCRIGSVGVTVPGGKSKLLEANSDGHGELIVQGRHVMMGYLGQREKTQKVFTPNGYFQTGDVAFIDKDNFIFITGREKDIIVTAGGENVAPTMIEDRVKNHLAIVSHAVIIGEKQKCLTLLITLKTLPDPVTSEPSDKLTPFVQSWISKYGGMNVLSVTEIVNETDFTSNHQLRKAIQRKIDTVNKEVTSHAQLIRNWCIIPQDFSMVGGELGPTLKVKRNVVTNKYAEIIERLYNCAPKT